MLDTRGTETTLGEKGGVGRKNAVAQEGKTLVGAVGGGALGPPVATGGDQAAPSIVLLEGMKGWLGSPSRRIDEGTEDDGR
ncbi:MAG: hypothetical protein PVH41_15020 [Anaerolineae bacterium]